MLFNQALDDIRTKPAFLSSLTAIPVRSMRFPGGTIGDNYLWNKEETARPDWFPFNYRGNSNDLDFDEFMGVVKCLGAQATIVLNLRYWVAKNDIESGMKLAEEWVRYANVQKDYGIKYWELGNEVYLDRIQKQSPMTATEYGKYYALFRQRLKQIDPSIELGMVMPHETDFVAAGDGSTWWDSAVKSAGGNIDYFIVHRYVVPQPRRLLRSGSTIGEMLDRIRTRIKSLTGRSIPIHLTEWNIGSRSASNDQIVKHDTIGHALFVADSLVDQAERGVRLGNYWPLIGPQDQGFLEKSDLSLNAAGRTMRMLAPLAGWRISQPARPASGALQTTVLTSKVGGVAAVLINWNSSPVDFSWSRIAGSCQAKITIQRPKGAASSSRALFNAAVEEAAALEGGIVKVPGYSVAVVRSSPGAQCSK